MFTLDLPDVINLHNFKLLNGTTGWYCFSPAGPGGHSRTRSWRNRPFKWRSDRRSAGQVESRRRIGNCKTGAGQGVGKAPFRRRGRNHAAAQTRLVAHGARGCEQQAGCVHPGGHPSRRKCAEKPGTAHHTRPQNATEGRGKCVESELYFEAKGVQRVPWPGPAGEWAQGLCSRFQPCPSQRPALPIYFVRFIGRNDEIPKLIFVGPLQLPDRDFTLLLISLLSGSNGRNNDARWIRSSWIVTRRPSQHPEPFIALVFSSQLYVERVWAWIFKMRRKDGFNDESEIRRCDGICKASWSFQTSQAFLEDFLEGLCK